MATATRASPQQTGSARAAQLRALIIQLEQRRVSLCARMDLIEREIQQLQAAPQLKSQK